MTFFSRRLWNLGISGAVAALMTWLIALYDLALRDASFLSGWLLVAGSLYLSAYNARKNLPFLPLIKSSTWLQAHVYVGLLVILLFLIHTSFALPNGPLEVVLWLLFVGVAATGLAGIVLSRTLPKRLRVHGERIIFERIPIFRAELADEVHDLARKSVTETASSTIAQYYSTRLHDYFHRPRNFFSHLSESEEPLQSVCREIKSLERYLDPQGKEILKEIEARVIAKNKLDHQYFLQLVLKGWLFVHIPLTYSLFLVAIVHVMLAYAFASGTL